MQGRSDTLQTGMSAPSESAHAEEDTASLSSRTQEAGGRDKQEARDKLMALKMQLEVRQLLGLVSQLLGPVPLQTDVTRYRRLAG